MKKYNKTNIFLVLSLIAGVSRAAGSSTVVETQTPAHESAASGDQVKVNITGSLGTKYLDEFFDPELTTVGRLGRKLHVIGIGGFHKFYIREENLMSKSFLQKEVFLRDLPRVNGTIYLILKEEVPVRKTKVHVQATIKRAWDRDVFLSCCKGFKLGGNSRISLENLTR